MTYIEENMKLRRGARCDEQEKKGGPADPQEELYQLSERYKVEKRVAEEGNVTNSMAMLTAIPEVDLGMECVLLL